MNLNVRLPWSINPHSKSFGRWKGRMSSRENCLLLAFFLSLLNSVPAQTNNFLICTLYLVPLANLRSKFRPPLLCLCFCKMSSTAQHNFFNTSKLRTYTHESDPTIPQSSTLVGLGWGGERNTLHKGVKTFP